MVGVAAGRRRRRGEQQRDQEDTFALGHLVGVAWRERRRLLPVPKGKGAESGIDGGCRCVHVVQNDPVAGCGGDAGGEQGSVVPEEVATSAAPKRVGVVSKRRV